jgi:SulP family sulfate permease
LPHPLTPKLFTTLAGYTRQQFLADLGAGIIVGIVALPLAIAFAIASGVPPERGLYTAIIAGFLISVLGGSRVQIGGPTGAFVVIVSGIVAQHGLAGLTVATLMAGVILVAMGLARLGGVIKYIPYPVITGFTSGIAVIILSTQVPDFLGLQLAQVPREFFGKWLAYLTHLGTLDPATLGVASATLLILVLWPRLPTPIPAPFVALLAATAAVQLLELDVATIGSRFGAIDASFPPFAIPAVSEATVVQLVGPAITIAILCAVESLLSAVVADGMIGGRHRSNMELVAQGAANIITPQFGGIPATGAIARTATNIKNGGRTPVAGIVHAVVLLLVTLFAGRWAALIPMAALAAILVMVAYHMSEWRTFRAELRAPKSDVAVLLTTFLLTVIVDLTVAIEVGMVLAAFLFMKRMAEVSNVEAISVAVSGNGEADGAGPDTLSGRRTLIPADVEIYEISGPFFFGAAEKFKDALSQVSRRPRALILDMERVPAMDSTGLRALRATVERCRKEGIVVIFCGLQPQPRDTIRRSPLGDGFSEADLSLTFDEAVAAGGRVERRVSGRTGEHATPGQ